MQRIWSAPTGSLFVQINHHYLIASHPAFIRNRSEGGRARSQLKAHDVEANPKLHSADLCVRVRLYVVFLNPREKLVDGDGDGESCRNTGRSFSLKSRIPLDSKVNTSNIFFFWL